MVWKLYLNKKFVVLLKENPFKPAYLRDFMRPLGEKRKIKRILRETSNKNKNETPLARTHFVRPFYGRYINQRDS